jgi:hypothetical protein
MRCSYKNPRRQRIANLREQAKEQSQPGGGNRPDPTGQQQQQQGKKKPNKP